MKKNLIKSTVLVGTFLVSSVSIAQKKNETDAAMHYKNTFLPALAENNMDAAKKALIKAKTSIDLAAENPETKESPKTLWLKGNIYSSFLVVGMQSMDTNFIKLAGDDAMEVSIEAYKKGYSISDKFDSDIEDGVNQNHDLLEGFAMMAYKAEQYNEAAETFLVEVKFYEAINKVDTNSIYNAGLCYDKVGKFNEAGKQFEALTKTGHKGAKMYAFAINAYRKAKNYDAAKAIAISGRTKYPQDKDVLLETVQISLDMNDAVGAEALLNEAIAKDPSNKLLHLTIGSIYIDLKQNEKAETAFNEALKIDPNFEDALRQLGGHLVNWAIDINGQANQLKYNDPKVKVLEAQSKELFNKAVTPLEKFLISKPNDVEVLTTLSQINRYLGNTDKSLEYKKRADAAKAGN